MDSNQNYRPVWHCRGHFCNKGKKCENGTNLSLGSLEVFIVDNQAQNFKCIINKRLMVLWQKRIKMLITKVQKTIKNNRSKISTHSHPEEGIERCCKEEREGSPTPIFPPPSFEIVRLLTGWMGFCSQISAMWVERGSPLYELKRVLYRVWGVALDWFLHSGRGFYPHDTILVFWLGLLLFREEFGMLLAWFWK